MAMDADRYARHHTQMSYPVPPDPYSGPPGQRVPTQPLVRPRLWRSLREKVVAGVVGGLAEKFDVQPGFARVLWVFITFFSGGVGLPLYLLLWAITKQHDLPPEPGTRRFFQQQEEARRRFGYAPGDAGGPPYYGG